MGTPRLEGLPHHTWDDHQLREGRWEPIHGTPYAMTPTPSIRHQQMSQNIATLLQQALAECDACRAPPPVDWEIGEDTVVQPDNLFHEKERMRHCVLADPEQEAAKVHRLHEGRFIKWIDVTTEHCKFNPGSSALTFDLSRIWA